jgi:hypothetical protein
LLTSHWKQRKHFEVKGDRTEEEEILFSDVQTTFLEVQLEKGNLDRPEGRQKVPDDFTKDTKEHVPVERIHTWFRNHKSKRKGGGKGGEGGS